MMVPSEEQVQGVCFKVCFFAFRAMVVFMLFFNGMAAAEPDTGVRARLPVVTVAAVVEKEVNPPDEYVGRVEAVQAVDLRARVEGYLEHIKFKEGGEVRAGDLLYIIEQAPYLARVDESRARVKEAEAVFTTADQYLKRLQAVKTGGVSATDLDTALSAALQAEAKLQEVKAGLAQAEIDLGYTQIWAPISGRIGRSMHTRGNLVGAASGPLARIVQLDPIRVVYSISDADLSRLAMDGAGGKAADCRLVPSLRLPDGSVYPTLGRFDFMDNQVDAGTGSIAVRAVFDNPDVRLLPGQYVTVQLNCKAGKRLPVVPQAAVQEDRDGRYVFVVNAQNEAQQRRITTGMTMGPHWSVESGLVVGEMIIVQGIQKVRPGQRVEPVSDNRHRGE